LCANPTAAFQPQNTSCCNTNTSGLTPIRLPVYSTQINRSKPGARQSSDIQECKEFFKLYTVLQRVKVKLSLCLTKYDAMKTYWGNGGMTTHIKLGVRDKWSASRPCGFTPGIHWRGGGVGPCRETKAGRPTRSLVTILTELLQLRSAEGRGVKATLHAF